MSRLAVQAHGRRWLTFPTYNSQRPVTSIKPVVAWLTERAKGRLNVIFSDDDKYTMTTIKIPNISAIAADDDRLSGDLLVNGCVYPDALKKKFSKTIRDFGA
jgi:hypothetical protein